MKETIRIIRVHQEIKKKKDASFCLFKSFVREMKLLYCYSIFLLPELFKTLS